MIKRDNPWDRESVATTFTDSLIKVLGSNSNIRRSNGKIIFTLSE